MTIRTCGAPRVLRTLLVLGLAFVAGCGGFKTVPVSGKVMQDGKPMAAGIGVSFVPDTAKGNEAAVACVGRIGADGSYTLKTAGVQASQSGDGAPLGWYKVVFVSLRGSPEITADPIYLDANRTPLSFEVVADPKPGQYDITLTK